MSISAIGIDIGSTTWKGVVIDRDARIVASLVEQTDPRIEAQTQRCLEELRRRAQAPADVALGVTGYGRKRVRGDRVITEITCHGRGAYAIVERAAVLVDVGGQDTKIIRVGSEGEILDFAMNDKCAAGTGRFLEVILQRLNISLDQVASLFLDATESIEISSTCTVFAESEVVSLVARGAPLEGIVRGLHEALAARVAALLRNSKDSAPLLMSGGVALNQAMVVALSNATGRDIQVLDNPQLVGALGAALAVSNRDG